MFKRTIKFPDYDGNEREEDFYFNLTKAEILEMELSTEGGIEKMVNKIISTQDRKKIIEVFKEIIQKSYGVKSDDGKRFIKNKTVLEEFIQTEAYSILFIDLATDADAAAKFIKGIMPKDLQQDSSIPASAK